MLNNEGWVSLTVLVLWAFGLLLGLPQLKKASCMESRLLVSENGFSANAGVLLRLFGICLLGALPGYAYSSGLFAGISACSLVLGVLFSLLFVYRRLCALPGASPFECLTDAPTLRVAAALCGLCSLFVFTAGALSLAARFISGAFSLHYTIALLITAAISLLLCFLQNPSGRAAMDRVFFFLPFLLLLGLSVSLFLLSPELSTHALPEELLAPLSSYSEDSPLWLRLCSCALWGFAAPGLVLPLKRACSSCSKGQKNKGFALSAIAFAVLSLLSVFLGFSGRTIDAALPDKTAAETVLLQLALWERLPSYLQGFFAAGMITLLLFLVQDGFRAMGDVLSWDVVQPLSGLCAEKPLLRIAALAPPVLVLPAFFAANQSHVSLFSFATLGLLLSAPLGMLFFLKALHCSLSPKASLLSLLLGEGLVLLGFLFSVLFWDVGLLPLVPALLLPLIFLLKEGISHGK